MDVETVLERAGAHAYLPESDLDLVRQAYACGGSAQSGRCFRAKQVKHGHLAHVLGLVDFLAHADHLADRGQQPLARAKAVQGADLDQAFQHAAVDLPQIDITDAQSAASVVSAARPDVVVNCAAYTTVDAAETDTKTAYAVNAEGVANLAKAADSCGAAVVHFSTDYVFDGSAGQPYVETDATNPLSVYGKSKLEGEKKLIDAYRYCDNF